MANKTIWDLQGNNIVKIASDEVARSDFANPERYKNIDKTTDKTTVTVPTSTTKTTTKIAEPKNEKGELGVRAVMNNMGLDNSKIGYSDGYVTYGNMRFKPTSIGDGTTYASRADITAFVDDIYRSQGKDPVRVTDYVAPAGLGSLSYTNERGVMVGGKTIPMLYAYDGRAVVDKNELDKAYAELGQGLGIMTSDELMDNYNNTYQRRIDSEREYLKTYPEWKYDPYSDPMYHIYKDLYLREGERAFRNVAAKLAIQNNGNMTSAAQTLANQQLGYYMQQLNDKVPELMKNSYARYVDEYNRRYGLYEDLVERGDKAFERSVELNEINKNDYKTQRDGEYMRNQQALEEKLAKLEYDAKTIQNFSEIFDLAERRGVFTTEEAILLNIPKKANGEYMTPNEIRVSIESEYFQKVIMPQLSYESALIISQMSAEYANKLGNDIKMAEVKLGNDKALYDYKKDDSFSE